MLTATFLALISTHQPPSVVMISLSSTSSISSPGPRALHELAYHLLIAVFQDMGAKPAVFCQLRLPAARNGTLKQPAAKIADYALPVTAVGAQTPWPARGRRATAAQ